MRSDWMRGLLGAEIKVADCGLKWASLDWSILNCGDLGEYWEGFADYLHNYELCNNEEVEV